MMTTAVAIRSSAPADIKPASGPPRESRIADRDAARAIDRAPIQPVDRVDPLPRPLVGTSVEGDLAERFGKSNAEIFSRIASMGMNTVRLGAYWKDIQPAEGQAPDFSRLDAQLTAATDAGLKVILSVGAKAPAWPEYYVPDWATPKPDGNNVGADPVFRKRVLAFDESVVKHVAPWKNIVMFQVENEPLDPSGPDNWRIDPPMLKAEAETIRQNDPLGRPLMVNVWSQPRKVLDDDRFGTVKVATEVADVVAVDVYPYIQGRWPDPFRKGRIQEFPQFAHDYVTRHGKQAMIGELQADDWGYYKVRADDIRANFDLARSQGYDDILFWRQSMVESALQRGDHSLLDVETELARSVTAPAR